MICFLCANHLYLHYKKPNLIWLMRVNSTLVILTLAFTTIAFSFCGSEAITEKGNNKEQNISLEDSAKHKFTNALINETSPYLLQHAHNPVNWHAWNAETLEKAKRENKLLLISIGYSACHWCHVMEHESFEDEEVAKIMNEHFISIKIDREERPDIDQIYMNAVHLMNQRGGWPLNCFALPDGRPFFGGTYFPKSQWLQLLGKVAAEYKNNPDNVSAFAAKLTEGIKQSELISLNPEKPLFTNDDLDKVVSIWSKRFDNKEGGGNGAPKFPIPNNYLFLLRYAHMTKNTDVLEHVKLTLSKMAFGGIYDQLGGGFARYSTDAVWKAPHFEKMLYDNAQMVSLYSEAYQLTKDPLYKQIVYETLEFVSRELTDETGACYSALDADSEGEEGKFYVWEKDELKSLLGDDFKVFADYYNVNNNGLWEGKYILLRRKSKESIAKSNSISVEDLDKVLEKAKKILMKERDTRIRPGLDDKSLTSWNGLMIKGYVDAYMAFDEDKFLESALKTGNLISTMLIRDDGGLYHSYKKGRTTINGYLEDYSFIIESFIALYEATFDEKWLTLSRKLMDYTIEHFHDSNSGMFFFTSDLDAALIARKMEINDNVIPASNSSIAKSLFMLGHYFYVESYNKIAIQMLNNVKKHMDSYPAGYSNWGLLMLNLANEYYEIAIVGKNASQKRQEMNVQYIPNKLYLGSVKDSKLPLLENKFVKGETMIYVCVNRACNLPVTEVAEALKQIQ